MKRKIFSFIRQSANKGWADAVSAKTSHEAVQKVMNQLAKGADPNFVIQNDGKQGTVLDLMPENFVEARLHIRRAGGVGIKAIKAIEAEGKELAAVRAIELRQRQEALAAAEEAHKMAVVALHDAEVEKNWAEILDAALAEFK